MASFLPERVRHRIDVEADPAIVLTGIAPGRRLEIAPRQRAAEEDQAFVDAVADLGEE